MERWLNKMTHKYMKVTNDTLSFYLTARFYNSYQAGSNNEPYFVKLSFSIRHIAFVFKITLYSKSLMHKHFVTKTFCANTINRFYFDSAVTYNDIVQSNLIYGDNKRQIRKALRSGVISSVAYSIIESFVMRDFKNIIKSIDFNQIIKEMVYFKNHI